MATSALVLLLYLLLAYSARLQKFPSTLLLIDLANMLLLFILVRDVYVLSCI